MPHAGNGLLGRLGLADWAQLYATPPPHASAAESGALVVLDDHLPSSRVAVVCIITLSSGTGNDAWLSHELKGRTPNLLRISTMTCHVTNWTRSCDKGN